VRSRTAAMWWGVAIEAPDPGALATFYSALLGWPVVHATPDVAIVQPPQPGVFVVCQRAEGYVAPTWPPADGSQRPMAHLDVQVGDLDEAAAEAVALGASLADHQPQDHVRVMLDPAGHPFCLCLETED